MAKRSPLDEPTNSAHAWTRYRLLMRWMMLFTVAVVACVLGFLRWQEGPAPLNFYIATGLGIGGTMMLAGALMGLVFLSSGTGHDEAVSDFDED